MVESYFMNGSWSCDACQFGICCHGERGPACHLLYFTVQNTVATYSTVLFGMCNVAFIVVLGLGRRPQVTGRPFKCPVPVALAVPCTCRAAFTAGCGSIYDCKLLVPAADGQEDAIKGGKRQQPRQPLARGIVEEWAQEVAEADD